MVCGMAHKRVINGPAVKAMRELVGIKHGRFAVAAGITPGYLSNIESGRKQPSPEVQRKIATELGVPLDAITHVVQTPDREPEGVAA